MLCDLRPSFFVIENVPGLYRFRKHREFLKKKINQLHASGYVVDYKMLSALEFGVPQDRERLFIVGFKRELAENTIARKLTQDEYEWFQWPEETHKG